MKPFHLVLLLFTMCRAAASVPAASDAPPPAATTPVGVYDSRLVAYAHFWSEPSQQAQRERLAEAKTAQCKGDHARYRQLADTMKTEQTRLHLQVFSTAPIPEAMTALADSLPGLQRKAGVTRLVSKWDTAALRRVAPADRVDVTDLLVREFNLPEQRRNALAQMRAAKPLPLWVARTLNFFGRL
ncbi:MAG: hypothetical protein HYV95_04715 [Opitutae bacterium]|nr:hypothetical protein [Opitutae bacterium]